MSEQYPALWAFFRQWARGQLPAKQPRLLRLWGLGELRDADLLFLVTLQSAVQSAH